MIFYIYLASKALICARSHVLSELTSIYVLLIKHI